MDTDACIRNWVVLYDGCCWDNIPLDSIPLCNSIMSKIFRMLHFELNWSSMADRSIRLVNRFDFWALWSKPCCMPGRRFQTLRATGLFIITNVTRQSFWPLIDSQSVQSFCQLSVSASGTCISRSVTRAGSTQTTTTTSRLMLISLPLSDLKLHHRIWQVA